MASRICVIAHKFPRSPYPPLLSLDKKIPQEWRRQKTTPQIWVHILERNKKGKKKKKKTKQYNKQNWKKTWRYFKRMWERIEHGACIKCKIEWWICGYLNEKILWWITKIWFHFTWDHKTNRIHLNQENVYIRDIRLFKKKTIASSNFVCNMHRHPYTATTSEAWVSLTCAQASEEIQTIVRLYFSNFWRKSHQTHLDEANSPNKKNQSATIFKNKDTMEKNRMHFGMLQHSVDPTHACIKCKSLNDEFRRSISIFIRVLYQTYNQTSAYLISSMDAIAICAYVSRNYFPQIA